MIKNASDKLVAHRGYTNQYPENTLLAIRAALDAGAKNIEIDVQLTKDKQAVLFHDRNLSRLCQQSLAVHDYTYDELKKFSSYSPDRFADKYKGEKIPLLSEVVNLFKGHSEVKLFVELKRISIESFSIDEVVDAVVPLVEPVKEQIVFISFSIDMVKKLRNCTRYPVGVVIDSWAEAKEKEDTDLQSIDPEYFFCDIDTLPKDISLSLLQSKIAVYECVDATLAANVLKRGVSLVETFDIKKMIKEFQLNTG